MRPWQRVVVLAALMLPATQAMAAAEYKIVTASERGTYIQIGRDHAGGSTSASRAENGSRRRAHCGAVFAR